MPFVIAAGAVVLAVIAFVVVSVTIKTKGFAAFPTGPATATIMWRTVPSTSNGLGKPAPQPFSGTVAGFHLQGMAYPDPDADTTKRSLATRLRTLTIAKWTGTLNGTPFSVKLTFSFSKLLAGPTSVAFTAVGTFGSNPVHAVASETHKHRTYIAITGSVGDVRFKGTVAEPRHRHGVTTDSATFMVLK